MSKKIKILPENLANMIAAGEVVERPASVVKELVENSIDAGADRIEIACQKSGKRMIRVADNGCGMEYEDALTCLERHATSKISTVVDLDSIMSLGFRGEALPSIASVSDMTLITKTASSQAATRILIQCGTIKNVSQTGAPIGTIVEIKDMFSNLPARAKFLRSDQTELTHIVQTIIRQSIPRYDISFIFTHNGHQNLHFARSEYLKQRLAQILGEGQMSDMLELEAEKDGIRCNGFISGVESTRSNPLGQYLYVNRRFIRSQILQKAVHDAYHPQLQRLRYPVFCILIEINPGRVDFNVHPTKLEVRFENLSKIVDLVGTAVKNTLNKPLIFPKFPSPKTAQDTGQDKAISFDRRKSYPSGRPSFSRQMPLMPDSIALSSRTRQMPLIKEEAKAPYKAEVMKDQWGEISETIPVSDIKIKSPHSELIPKGPFIQIDNTYIIYETQDGLVIVDQHAAHERINFEKTICALLRENTPTQTLITQPFINVSHEEEALMEQVLPLLKDLGFFLEPFGERTYILRSVPVFLKTDLNNVLQAIIRELMEYRSIGGKEQIIEPIAATIACHLSIKAHEPLKKEEMEYLINDLLSTQNPFSCPHGRPTLFRLSIKELEKNFRRQ